MSRYRAANIMKSTGQKVTLKVAKRAALHHGLGTLLEQPSPRVPQHAGMQRLLWLSHLAPFCRQYMLLHRQQPSLVLLLSLFSTGSLFAFVHQLASLCSTVCCAALFTNLREIFVVTYAG